MLSETRLRSEDVAAPDRLAYWADLVGRTHAPVHMESEHAEDFRAMQRVLDLGAVTVWPATFQQLVIRRTPRLVRRSDPGLFHLSVLVGGTGVGTWDDQEAVYQPSDLHINDSSVPWEIRTGSAPVSVVGVEIPKALLPLPTKLLRRGVPRRVAAGTGMVALTTQFLTQVVTDAPRYRPEDGPRLGAVLVDLVAALFAHAAEAEGCLPEGARQRALLLQVKRFIRAHLHDPGLRPGDVAAAHHISVSYLHRLFKGEETTVAAWIRRCRLEAARRDLADPALTEVPVHVVAARWGFSRASDFNRSFRTVYGMPPGEYRKCPMC
ncbi:AraC family transcriptional regulator [Streptomyces sp. NPDC002055]|uniref:AraC family transcriptional regulator n=1 Tax=Streptomyces sp. NPDC002055 TaxID=3154534 RepID=UPI003329A886